MKRFMKRALVLGFLFAIFLGVSASAMADIFTPANSSGVYYAKSDGGFYTTSTQYASGSVQSCIVGSDFHLAAGTGTSYSDAAIVLYFDGGLTLGNLLSVSAVSTGGPLAVNLWLDTGGDGQFFLYSSGILTSLNSDSYGGAQLGAGIDGNTEFYMLGGNGAGNTYTLANLQAGAVSGIGADTLLALWIGVTNPYGADISSVTVTATPLPPSALLMGSGLLGLVGLRWRRSRARA